MNNVLNKGFKWRQNRGVIIVLMTVALPVLLALAGLAIDSGRAYGVRGKLSAAVDAASLAAAKAVANGEAAGTAAANKYFTANFPAGYLGSTPTSPNISYSYSAAGDISVDVSATANMPTSFSKVVGLFDMDIGSNAQTIRRTVDLSFVVDNTTSLRLGALGDVTQDVIDRSKDFLSNFNESFDRIALIKYAFGAEIPVDFNAGRGFSRNTMEAEIDAFEFGGNGLPSQFTNISEGMYQAIDALNTAANPASLRVIVFFTDGAPNTFASGFSFTAAPDKAGAIRSSSGATGTPRGLWEVDQVAQSSAAPWNFGGNIDDNLAELPLYYTAHDPFATDFMVINPAHPRRPVTNYDPVTDSAQDLYEKVNRISRNLPEDMAAFARQNGIFVLTLGLGSRLQEQTGPDNERGEDMLMRMANDPRMQSIPALAADFRPGELQGIYCHAVDEDALGPCFEEMLKVIIRLTI